MRVELSFINRDFSRVNFLCYQIVSKHFEQTETVRHAEKANANDIVPLYVKEVKQHYLNQDKHCNNDCQHQKSVRWIVENFLKI